MFRCAIFVQITISFYIIILYNPILVQISLTIHYIFLNISEASPCASRVPHLFLQQLGHQWYPFKYNYIYSIWLIDVFTWDWWVSSGTFVYFCQLSSAIISSQRMSTRWTTWRSVRWRLPFHCPPLRPFCWQVRCCPKWARGLALIHHLDLCENGAKSATENHRFPSWNSDLAV